MQNFKKVKIYNPNNYSGDYPRKIVQLIFKEEPWLVYGGAFHSVGLEWFLKEQNIKVTIQAPWSELEGPDYKVLGMGYAYLDFEEKEYHWLKGRSEQYNIGINEEQKKLLEETLKAESWTFL
jgi:hypothetical protein